MALQNPMNAGVFQWMVPALNSSGLIPAAGYNVTFYAAGTTNPQAVYTDPALQVPYSSPSNVVNLNAQGYAVIYLANMAYKYVVSDTFGNPVFVQDNYVGGTNGAGFGGAFVSNIAALKELNTNAYSFAYVAGYYGPNDGGDGVFFNTTSSAPDDGGYTIKSTFDVNKNWNRINDINGNVRAASFGYTPSKNASGDQTEQLQSADAYAATLESAILLIDAGTGATLSSMTFSSAVVRLPPGCQFNATTSATLIFNGLVEAYGNDNNQSSVGAGIFPIFGTGITAILCSRQTSFAEWFGANTGLSDNTTVMGKWITAGGAVFTLSPGNWNYANPQTFPWPSNGVVILNGTLVAGVGHTSIPVGFYLPNSSQIRVNTIVLENGTVLSNFTNGLNISGNLNVAGGTFTAAISATGTISTNSLSDINSGRSITAQDNITALTGTISGPIVSGTVVESLTYVQANVGTATGAGSTMKASGQTNLVFSGGSVDSFPLPANSLINPGDRVSFICAGSRSGSSGAITFTISFPGMTPRASLITPPFTNGNWVVRGEIFYETSTSVGGCFTAIADGVLPINDVFSAVAATPSVGGTVICSPATTGLDATVGAFWISSQVFNQ